jgi:hypothetical protein
MVLGRFCNLFVVLLKTDRLMVHSLSVSTRWVSSKNSTQKKDIHKFSSFARNIHTTHNYAHIFETFTLLEERMYSFNSDSLSSFSIRLALQMGQPLWLRLGVTQDQIRIWSRRFR